MPYRKVYSRRRRYRRKPIGRMAIYRRAGSQLWKDVKYLKSIVNVEKKFIDITNSAQNISSTPSLVILNPLTTGDTMSTRDGQSIKMISHRFSFTATINAAGTAANVRIIILRDKQANGAAPAAGDVLQSSTNLTSPLNLSNGKRFKIYRDMQCSLSLNGNETYNMQIYYKMAAHTRFNTGNAGTAADIQTNTLYLLYMSDVGANYPTLTYYSRVRFIDN